MSVPPIMLKQLGTQPARGLLLCDAPGRGKTLIGRTIGKILSPARHVTVTSGPEIMEKHVGSSEANKRNAFDSPPDLCVQELPAPTLVIGLTNRRSLMDDVLLRAGRFEVQIEVPPPRTTEQRMLMLNVRMKHMHQSGRALASDAPIGTFACQN